MVKDKRNFRLNSIISALTGLVIIIALQLANNSFFTRVDLTSEKRHTLREETKTLLESLEDELVIKVYLEGEFPADFRKLRMATFEMLEEFSAYSNGQLSYEFINPSESEDEETRAAYWQSLVDDGLKYTNITIRGKDGVQEKIIFPGAIVAYRGRELPVQLLRVSVRTPDAEMINASLNDLEYNLTSTIARITSATKKSIAIIQGHGEIANLEVQDLVTILAEQYEVRPLTIREQLDALLLYDLAIIAAPQTPFSEKDKFILDQFLMKGGKLMFLVDGVKADMDSLQRSQGSQIIGVSHDVNLDDMLFNYGVRINKDLLLDQNCAPIALNVGQYGDKPNLKLFPWYFYPTLVNSGSHPISKNLNPLYTQFLSSIDTVGFPYISKSILWYTSNYTRLMRSPVRINLNMVSIDPDFERNSVGPQPVSVLLEGKFKSLYKNRIPPQIQNSKDINFKEEAIIDTKVLVVADGDIARSKTNKSKGLFYPLGFDPYVKKVIYSNRDFMLNAVNYLLDDSGLIQIRGKKIKLRKLNNEKVLKEKSQIQIANLSLPVLLIALIAVGFAMLRKKKYAQQKN